MDTKSFEKIFPEIDFNNRWCWCNPPYGKSGMGLWPTKLTETPRNIVCLVPASVGSKWFLPFWSNSNALVFFNKRLHYGGAPTGAQFDSCLAIKGHQLTSGQLDRLRLIGTVIHSHGCYNYRGDETFKLTKRDAEALV